jgi:hypothetical protein
MNARGHYSFYYSLVPRAVVTCGTSSQQNPRKLITTRHQEPLSVTLGAGCRPLAALGGDRFRLGITGSNRKAPNSAAAALLILLLIAARIVGIFIMLVLVK